MLSRRAFFLNSLKGAGIAATLSMLDARQLLAIPQEPTFPPTWTWDGTPLGYLKALHDQFAAELQRRGHALQHVDGYPAGAKTGYRHGAFTAIIQSNVVWQLNPNYRLGMAGFFRAPEPGEQLVYDGMVSGSSDADPIPSLPIAAKQFADRVTKYNAEAYFDLEIPEGLTIAARQGPFRLLSQYDIKEDAVLLRIDTLFGSRRYKES